jgi:hypothetical protein
MLRPTLDNVASTFLNIYQVAIPPGNLHLLEQAFQQIGQGGRKALLPMDVIGDIFSAPTAKYVRVIVDISGKSGARRYALSPLLDCVNPLPSANNLRNPNL